MLGIVILPSRNSLERTLFIVIKHNMHMFDEK